jgi:TRAP-type mannitol/chloroaromatic compound transport system permease large subunit
MADQLGRSVGDMYAGAFVPGLILCGLYIGYITLMSIFRPTSCPALPPEARSLKDENGKSGVTSLLIATLIAVAVGTLIGRSYKEGPALDEMIVVGMCAGVGIAFLLASINRFSPVKLMSSVAQKVIFVLIPPLALIFLVLGTIFLGIATPTEGGAMGAAGAMIIAMMKKRLSLDLMKQGMESTAKLSAFVMFILVGATVWGLVFRGVSGDLWVEHLMTGLPGGQMGFLIVVNIMFFGLAFFLDFFELAFILVPLVAPVADKLGIDLIWFGVLLAVNMQTSFMHPPFGFALFYLRSVAPAKEYKDAVTGKMTAPVTTSDIYWGAIPFVVIQIIMVALIIIFPGIVQVEKKAAQAADAPLELNLESEAATPDLNLPAPTESGDAGAVDPKQLQFSTESEKN